MREMEEFAHNIKGILKPVDRSPKPEEKAPEVGLQLAT